MVYFRTSTASTIQKNVSDIIYVHVDEYMYPYFVHDHDIDKLDLEEKVFHYYSNGEH